MRRFDVVRGPQHLHFGLAVLAAIGAAVIRASLTPFFGDRNQLVIFYPAIMVSAWWGGVWPGVVATVVSAALDRYLFLEPLFTPRLAHHGDKLALTVFIATGVVISVLNENLHQNAAREHKARADAEQAREEANMANRTKDFFLAAVSHDLRAPMTAALGWADMLSKHMLDDAHRARATEAIRRSLSRQLLLVNDLLDTVAILSGKLRVEQKNVDVEGVVRAALEIAEPLAERKQIRVGMECDAGAGTVVVGDSARLQQVLSNLLTNAIKFTPDRGAVRVRLRRADQSAEIQVIDTGKGIPDSALRFVFDQFWQADGDSSTQPDRGVGLGLSIAKHLVMAHGGRIDVTSAGDGQGSTFTVRLPLALTPPLNEATSRVSVSMLFDGAPVTEIDGGTVAEEVNHTPGRPSLDAVSS